MSGMLSIRSPEKEPAAVVLNYRDAVGTMECLRSIKGQVGRVVVWDNSDDQGASATQLAQYLRDSATEGVEIVRSETNLGFAAGVNAAIERVNVGKPPRHVLLLNNDATLPPNAVSKLLKALSSNPSAAAVTPIIHSNGRQHGLLYHHRWFAIQSRRKLPGSFTYASGCCLLVDTQNVSLPLFDQRFFMYAEDVELGWRIHQSGKSLIQLDDVVVEHLGSASSRRGSSFYEYHVSLGTFLLTRKICTSGEYPALLLFRTVSMALRALLRSARAHNVRPLIQTWRAFRRASDW